MAKLDNPAGRLHAILTEYHAAAAQNVCVADTWAKVLEVPRGEVPIALTEVAGLIPAVQTAVNHSGDSAQIATVDHYRSMWARPVIAPEHPMDTTPSPGKDLVNAGSLVALGLLSSFLSSTRSEGTVPGQTCLTDLTAEVVAAIDELASDEDLPSEIRRLVRDRLEDILWALDKIRFRGPDAARAAAERLAFVTMIAPEEARARASMKKALKAGGCVWAALLSGPAVEPGIEAWSHIFGALGRGLGG